MRWPGRVPSGSVREQVIGTHDIVATALDLAGVGVPAGQCLDAVSLVPVLTGARDDAQPVRGQLLVQSSPGRDAGDDGGIKGGPLTGREKRVSAAELHGKEPDGDKSIKRRIRKGGLPSDGMAHAVHAGDWKLVIDIADQPAALYDLRSDPMERDNRIADAAQAERVRMMTEAYRSIRSSPRSTPASP